VITLMEYLTIIRGIQITLKLLENLDFSPDDDITPEQLDGIKADVNASFDKLKVAIEKRKTP